MPLVLPLRRSRAVLTSLVSLTALLASLLLGITAPAAHAAPSAPTQVTAVPGDRAASVSWTAVTGASGYTVRSTPGDILRAVSGGVTSAVVDGLINGTSYTFTVVARDASGFSADSAPSRAVVPATVPDPPTQVQAAPADGAAEVSWTRPVSDGGSSLTGYTVTSSPEGVTRTAGPGATSVLVTGLTNGTTYVFTVTASNDRGTSTPSLASPAVVPAQGAGTVDPGPGTTDPGTTDPGTTDPGTTDPGTTDPGPGSGNPGTTDPGTGTGPSASASPVASAAPSASTSPSSSPAASTPAGPAGSGYTGLSAPVRVLDSRTGTGTTAGRKSGPVVLDLSERVPTGATAAVLNVTVTNPTRAGFVVLHADGSPRPGTSNVNVAAGQTQANEAVVTLPASRKVVVHVDSTSAHVVTDLVGWFAPQSGGRLDVRTPVRVLDTRTTDTPRRSGEVILDLRDRLPAGATSVVLNVTVTGGDARGFVVAHPTGAARPGTSNVNFDRGQTQANEVFSRLGTGANAGRVSLFVDSSRAAVIADLVAVVLPDGGTDGGGLTTTAPTRLLDTRSTGGRRTGVVEVALPAAVPADARAVVLNVTATGALSSGFVTAFADATPPATSNVNFRPGATQANQVVVAVTAQRTVRLLVGGQGAPQTHVIADLVAALH